MAAVATLGRLPEIEEFPEAPLVIERFGSLKRAFVVVRRVTGEAEWEAIAQRRREDLLVYLALAPVWQAAEAGRTAAHPPRRHEGFLRHVRQGLPGCG